MHNYSKYETWYGRSEPPPDIIQLKAGHFSVEFQDGDLRYYRNGDQELIRRVYVAIRDVNWNTIPAQISDLRIDTAENHFHIDFSATHKHGPLEFQWHAILGGFPDGSITFEMDGQAKSDFRYCRMGFCVLHPITGFAGRPYQANTPQGMVSGVLPEMIAPQKIENGFEVPLFPSCSSLVIRLADGTRLFTGFEGDLFEMEDQRNWTDGSYKTYCTPLSLGYPHQAITGQLFRQKITLQVEDAPSSGPGEPAPISLIVGPITDQILPDLGFEIPQDGTLLTTRLVEFLRRLHPDHLKVEILFSHPDWREGLERARAIASQLGSPLELALFLGSNPEEELPALGGMLYGVPVRRTIVFHESEASSGSTSPQWINLAREHLSAFQIDAPLVGGTNGNFAELNRQPPDVSETDGVAYPINPQVHAADERSLIEAISAQRDTVLTARRDCGSLPIHISSVTLKPPYNQAAQETEQPQDTTILPANVDPRQMSLFAAAWTVGSLHSLASAGVASVTYYQTAGWRGLLENAAGSPLPEQFLSSSEMVFPVYWIFHSLAGYKKAALLGLQSTQPLAISGFALQHANNILLLVSNLTPLEQTLRIQGFPKGGARLKVLNEDTFSLAAGSSHAFWDDWQALPVSGEIVHIHLKPYQTSFIENQSDH